jgi:hypothetical protein
VTSTKDSQPAQVVHSLELTAGNTIYGVVHNCCASKGGRAGILDAVGNIESTEPVANPVSIAGPDQDLDAGLDNRRESSKEGSRV